MDTGFIWYHHIILVFYSVNPIGNYDLKNDYTALVNLFDDETRKLLDGLFVSMLNFMN